MSDEDNGEQLEQAVYDDPNPPKWPNNRIAANRWFQGLHALIYQLQFNFSWHKHPRFGGVKYLNIRIDTRNGNFLVFCENSEGQWNERITPDELGINYDPLIVMRKSDFDRLAKVG